MSWTDKKRRKRSGLKICLFGILACQSALIEDFVFAACNQSWLTFVAEEEAVRVAGNGKAREWQEAGGWRMWINLRWAFEADDSFRVASLWQQIRPVASVDSLVVDKTFGAWKLDWCTIFAFDVAGGALIAVWVDSKLVFATGRWESGGWRKKINYKIAQSLITKK